jgi:copper chaperone CopZ
VKKNSAVKKRIEANKEKVIPNSSSVLAIEGMVCKMGCGASIRKALNDVGGVAKCDIDFKEERKVNLLKINYDSTYISEQKIVQLISTMNDGQFKIAIH